MSYAALMPDQYTEHIDVIWNFTHHFISEHHDEFQRKNAS